MHITIWFAGGSAPERGGGRVRHRLAAAAVAQVPREGRVPDVPLPEGVPAPVRGGHEAHALCRHPRHDRALRRAAGRGADGQPALRLAERVRRLHARRCRLRPEHHRARLPSHFQNRWFALGKIALGFLHLLSITVFIVIVHSHNSIIRIYIMQMSRWIISNH